MVFAIPIMGTTPTFGLTTHAVKTAGKLKLIPPLKLNSLAQWEKLLANGHAQGSAWQSNGYTFTPSRLVNTQWPALDRTVGYRLHCPELGSILVISKAGRVSSCQVVSTTHPTTVASKGKSSLTPDQQSLGLQVFEVLSTLKLI